MHTQPISLTTPERGGELIEGARRSLHVERGISSPHRGNGTSVSASSPRIIGDGVDLCDIEQDSQRDENRTHVEQDSQRGDFQAKAWRMVLFGSHAAAVLLFAISGLG